LGESVEKFKRAKEQYDRAEDVEFEPDFDDFRYGYWGQPDMLEAIQIGINERYPGRISTEKFYSLGPKSWYEVMSVSSKEPNLGLVPILSTGELSVGGWTDFVRTMPLLALNPRSTIAITSTREDVIPFVDGATRLMGATEEERESLYSFDKESDVTISLSQSNGVWCVDWISYDPFDMEGIFNNAYFSPMESEDPYLLGTDYPEVKKYIGLRGCTPFAPKGTEHSHLLNTTWRPPPYN